MPVDSSFILFHPGQSASTDLTEATREQGGADFTTEAEQMAAQAKYQPTPPPPRTRAPAPYLKLPPELRQATIRLAMIESTSIFGQNHATSAAEYAARWAARIQATSRNFATDVRTVINLHPDIALAASRKNIQALAHKSDDVFIAQFQAILNDPYIELPRGLPLEKKKLALSMIASASTPNLRELAVDMFHSQLTATRLRDEILDHAAFPKITTLCLRSNPIRSDGARALAEGLPSSQVTKLDLHGAELDDEGAAILASALAKTKLTQLDAGNNRAGNAGVKAYAEALPDSSLTTLILYANGFDDEGAEKLAEYLPKSKLTHLNVDHNRLSKAAINAFSNAEKGAGRAIMNYEDFWLSRLPDSLS